MLTSGNIQDAASNIQLSAVFQSLTSTNTIIQVLKTQHRQHRQQLRHKSGSPAVVVII